jgi:hypothetical protein
MINIAREWRIRGRCHLRFDGLETHEHGIRDPDGIMYKSGESQSNNFNTPDT